MSKFRILAAAAVVVAGSGAASAADFVPAPIYTPPPVYTPVQAYNWTGPYAGVLLGYGWSTHAPNAGTSGLVAGGYIGYNAQGAGPWVMGAEADLQWSNRRVTGAGIDVNWTSNFRLRAGYAVGSFLPYAAVGLALAGVDDNGTFTGTEVGYTVGVGIEAALTSNVVGRIEYLYSGYGTVPGFPAATFSTSEVRAGIGFRF